jgi:RNA polymerase sigma-70 factor (ECF subfamily)
LDSEVLDSLAAKQWAGVEIEDRRQSALQNCLSKLNSRDRELLELRYRRNVTSRQLAAELSRPADSVYKALQRIRRRLQQCIERSLASEDRQYD